MRQLPFLLIIVAGLPARWIVLHRSIWTDEAWVADSVLAPTVHGMLFFDRWVQSTPALFLVLMRAALVPFGLSEGGLRAVPWLAGVAALVVIAAALQRIVPPVVSLLGTALAAGNYWAIEYAQQAKPYETDLLVSGIFLYGLIRIWQSELTWWGVLAATLGAGAAGFLSFPAVFWYPAFVLVVAAADSKLHRSLRAGAAAAALGLAILINYIVFVRPNLASSLVREWRLAFFGRGGLLLSAGGFLTNVRELLLPAQFPGLWLIGSLLVAGLAFGIARAASRLRRRETDAGFVLMVAGAGLASAMAASFLRLYPLLLWPRFILWMLPIFTLVLCYAVEPLARVLSARAWPVAAVCLCALVGETVVLGTHPRMWEQNRQAVTYLATHAAQDDTIYVHGGVSEQFAVYERMLGWIPPRVFQGAAGWPCCPVHPEMRFSQHAELSMQADVEALVSHGAPGRVWALVPSGAAGHWSRHPMVLPGLRDLPPLMAAAGCREEQMNEFGYTRVYAFLCR